MACFRPLKAYRAQGGGVQFDSRGSASLHPFDLPCGQCIGCRAQRARMWALRAVHEAEMHDKNCFLTLTYDNENLPKDGSLNMEDWQLFAKRLRERCGRFRFLMCGEYGERTFRPHYHACVFGLDFVETRVRLPRSRGNPLWTSSVVLESWQKGHISIGELTYESAEYVARYVMKKLTGERSVIYGERRPPFLNASRRPGLGSSWLERYISDVYPSDEVRLDKRKFRPPRFYDDRLSRELPELAASLKAKRISAVGKYAADLTDERLKVREELAERRLAVFGRNLDNE